MLCSVLDKGRKFRIRQGAQGSVPNALSGVFSKMDLAKQHIDAYLNGLKTRGTKRKTNDSEKSASPS